MRCPECSKELKNAYGVAVHWRQVHDGEPPDGFKMEHDEETKERIRQKRSEQVIDKDHRLAMSQAMSGRQSPMKGLSHSDEARKQISESLRHGDDDSYPREWTTDLKETVRERHDRKCVFCNIDEDELDVRLDVHHIDGDKSNCNLENLVPLCRSCHISITADDYLTEMQLQLFAWQQENYPDSTVWTDVAGIAEEFGELASTQIDIMIGREPDKFESNEEAMKDAIGDVLIYLSQLSSKHGISFADALNSASAEIQDEDSHHG